MNTIQNETTNYNRMREITPISAATPAIQATGRVCRPDETAKGCGRNSQGQMQTATTVDAKNGYLKCRFFPLTMPHRKPPEYGIPPNAETDCFQSLCHLADFLGIEHPERVELPFPQNAALAIWDLRAKARKIGAAWDKLDLVQGDNRYFFEAEYCHNLGWSLYYIPTAPLLVLLCDPRRRSTAQLLLSVYAYLYTHAGIPYHGDKCTYLYHQYSAMPEWLDGAEQSPETQTHRAEVRDVLRRAKTMKRIITCPRHLHDFRQRLEAFSPKDALDWDCLTIARTAYSLYREFPGRSFNRAAPKMMQDEELEVTGMAQYISFVDDVQGWVWKEILEGVNADLQECMTMQVPTIVHRFNGLPIRSDTFRFEGRLYEMLRQLIDLFSNIKTPNHDHDQTGS
ncbi:MAG: hypothetical protein P0Y53_01430 [Candidatus Pseudobacter hemicellulosilyticus]|uniref:Uncharacterized protein n=1 Tax=Candidatus Pseudobacter hemicellulosilyticus TaxID=3121375 RepID=A0AAJ5WU14_9BACT|nr:MAG: hypothetical protein P0Y53_01430 [Pseudobacter sp.]